MSIVRPLLLGACLLGVGTTRVELAGACGNEVERRRDPVVENLQLAERLLRQGDPAAAGRAALRAFPRPRDAKLVQTSLGQRALRVFALAVVRTEGAWSAQGVLTAPAAKEENRKWAVLKLRERSVARALDPAAATDLAEALARHPDTEQEAQRMLEVLADKDVITSAEGWAALALLRGKAGDARGQQLAENECRKRAVRPAACGGQAES